MVRSEYAVFLGCMIPALQPFVEAAGRRVFNELGVTLHNIEGETCCPVPEAPKALNYEAWCTIAARNLALAERMGLDVMAICSGCYETLEEVNNALKKNRELRDYVNEKISSESLEFQGKIRVQNVIGVLYDVIGIKRIGKLVTETISGIKVCPQVGCRLYKSEEELDSPRKFRELAGAIGCEVINYETERVCCGLPTLYADPNFGILNRTKPKLDDIRNASADCIVVVCPACLHQFEIAQLDLKSKGHTYDIPCFNLLELMALSFGASSDSLGLQWHRIRSLKFLKTIEGGK